MAAGREFDSLHLHFERREENYWDTSGADVGQTSGVKRPPLLFPIAR